LLIAGCFLRTGLSKIAMCLPPVTVVKAAVRQNGARSWLKGQHVRAWDGVPRQKKSGIGLGTMDGPSRLA